MWRPEGWEPITGPRHQELYDYKGDVAYEMGADAMLEAIYKETLSRHLQKGKIGVIGYGKLKTDITLEDVMRLLGGDIIPTEG